MNEISSVLMKEHQLILKVNQLMMNCFSLHQSQKASFPIFELGREYVDFIQKFADRLHHAKEEDILFRYLKQDGLLQHCNPIPQMLHEHEVGRSLVQRMIKAIESSDEGELIEASMSYVALLTDHIFKEDNILYPMAENAIPDDQKGAIQKEYEEAEERMESAQLWNRFEEFRSRLEKDFFTAQ